VESNCPIRQEQALLHVSPKHPLLLHNDIKCFTKEIHRVVGSSTNEAGGLRFIGRVFRSEFTRFNRYNTQSPITRQDGRVTRGIGVNVPGEE
jgi:hypothetical protein